MTDNYYCSLHSLEIEQPIFGTATASKTIWLLLEYPYPWAARATENNDLPEKIQRQLEGWLSSFPEARLVFIKRGPVAGPQRRFYVAITREVDRRLIRFNLDQIEHLDLVDLAAVIRGDPGSGGQPVTEPLYLVCTNGKRDRCCAKFGLPVFQNLMAQVETGPSEEPRVWQCTHIGGHRYAPVVGVVPAGATYRLLPNQSAQTGFVTAHEADQLVLNGFRGRSCFEQPVQAAEFFLRRETGRLGLDDYSFVETRPADDGSITVLFENAEGRHCAVSLTAGQTEPLLASCGKPKYKPQPRYKLLNIAIQAGHPIAE